VSMASVGFDELSREYLSERNFNTFASHYNEMEGTNLHLILMMANFGM
jgi:hypothetical protein